MVPERRPPLWEGSDTLQPVAGAEGGEQERKQGSHQVGRGLPLESSNLPPITPPPLAPSPTLSNPVLLLPWTTEAPGQFYWSLWKVLNEEMTQVMTTYGLSQKGV